MHKVKKKSKGAPTKKASAFAALEAAYAGERFIEPEKKKKGKQRITGNVCEFDGHIFDSGEERDRYIYLRSLKDAGKIQSIICQPTIECIVNGELVTRYTPDFLITLNNGRQIYEDYKPDIENEAYRNAYLRETRLKIRLVKALFGFEVCLVFTITADPDLSYSFIPKYDLPLFG